MKNDLGVNSYYLGATAGKSKSEKVGSVEIITEHGNGTFEDTDLDNGTIYGFKVGKHLPELIGIGSCVRLEIEYQQIGDYKHSAGFLGVENGAAQVEGERRYRY
uniref:Uncharacterized protein n=1 Tax=viral metagenome TaxID=1070528 RepID=A0A6C0EI13_9ZZZZ